MASRASLTCENQSQEQRPTQSHTRVNAGLDIFALNGQYRVLQRCFGAKYQFLFEIVQKGPKCSKRLRLTTLERWQACHVWPFLGHPQSWTVDPSVKKRLIIKYGRYPWKMSKISMKKWPFFAIVLLWMARYGSETSFLLIFSANDDVVKSFVKIGCSGVPKPTSHPYFD